MSNEYTEIIKELRTKYNFSQEHVASTIGVSRPTYTAIESGKQKLDIEEAKKLANMYSIGVDELLSGRISDIEKYKQMILNALETGADRDGKITKTKLAKLVYLADFTWFYNHLVPMSGMSYRRLPQGPVPDVYFRAIDELIDSGALNMEERGRAFMLSMADTGSAPSNQLKPEEKQMLQRIGKAWKGKQTQEIVNFTHEQLPWQICREGEVIPYGLITQEDPKKVYGNARVAEL